MKLKAIKGIIKGEIVTVIMMDRRKDGHDYIFGVIGKKPYVYYPKTAFIGF